MVPIIRVYHPIELPDIIFYASICLPFTHFDIISVLRVFLPDTTAILICSLPRINSVTKSTLGQAIPAFQHPLCRVFILHDPLS